MHFTPTVVLMESFTTFSLIYLGYLIFMFSEYWAHGEKEEFFKKPLGTLVYTFFCAIPISLPVLIYQNFIK